MTIFQVSVTFKLLWPLATTKYDCLLAANSLSETYQVLWPLATNIYVAASGRKIKFHMMSRRDNGHGKQGTAWSLATMHL